MDEDRCELGEFVVWSREGRLDCAWRKSGSLALFIHEEEKDLNPLEFAMKINTEMQEGKFRCSRCGKLVEGEDNLHYHLFATMSCDDCHEKLEQVTRDEIARGAICLICHKPYSQCYC